VARYAGPPPPRATLEVTKDRAACGEAVPDESLLVSDGGLENVLVAGRCIASQGDAWEATRVIPPAALTGQVCGVAARLAHARAVTPDALSAQDIQRELRAMHMPYHWSDVR
jgi:hypothetical protein